MNGYKASEFIAKQKDRRIGRFFDGRMVEMLSMEEIPHEHLIKVPTDNGYYILSACICDGSKGCAIGAPAASCTVICPIECGRYRCEKILPGTRFMIPFAALEELF